MPSITEHDNDNCKSCKAAGQQQTDHYALGIFRWKLARALGLHANASDLTLKDLQTAHAEAGYPRLG